MGYLLFFVWGFNCPLMMVWVCVMHGVKSIEGRIELEQDLKQRITEIELKLKGR